MSNHEKFKIDRAFMRALDRTLPREYTCDQLRGFGVRVAAKGTTTYFYRFLDGTGRPKRVTLGKWPDVEPAAAREAAKAHGALHDKKGDSLAIKVAKHEARIVVQRKLGKLTLRQFLTQRYDDHLRTHGRSGTKNSDLIRSKGGFACLLDRDMALISGLDIERWRAERLKAGIKPATTNRYLNALRGAFSRACEWGLLETHPMKLVRKQDEPGLEGDRFLLPDEEARLRAALDQYDDAVRAERAKVMRRLRRVRPAQSVADATRPAVLIALNTGARRGEILKLEWRHVDLNHALVTFPASATKSGKSRVLALNREALAVLTEWRAQCPPDAVFVFPNETGKAPLRELKNWPKVRDAANITRLRFRLHDARHHAASRLVMAGVDLFSVSRVLGHADGRQSGRYAHLSPAHLRDTMAVLDSPNTIGQTVAASVAA
ncbi:site-specific integrase [Paraburkholderia sp. A3BS-1L]|uniref:tyrosine-type recombinase/integrase n=1 Tax=Paraburkholderia sp. A3BS-1L TaxID=3028375 RepID=UPI003DA967D0